MDDLISAIQRKAEKMGIRGGVEPGRREYIMIGGIEAAIVNAAKELGIEPDAKYTRLLIARQLTGNKSIES